MLKFLKQLLIWIGVVVIVATIVVMVWDTIQLNQLIAVVNASKSTQASQAGNPLPWLLIAVAAGLVGGLLLGLGIGLPGRTFKQRVNDQLKSADQQVVDLNQVTQQPARTGMVHTPSATPVLSGSDPVAAVNAAVDPTRPTSEGPNPVTATTETSDDPTRHIPPREPARQPSVLIHPPTPDDATSRTPSPVADAATTVMPALIPPAATVGKQGASQRIAPHPTATNQTATNQITTEPTATEPTPSGQTTPGVEANSAQPDTAATGQPGPTPLTRPAPAPEPLIDPAVSAELFRPTPSGVRRPRPEFAPPAPHPVDTTDANAETIVQPTLTGTAPTWDDAVGSADSVNPATPPAPSTPPAPANPASPANPPA
ncbi:MAG: hypothetical protein LBV00_12530 [Propionibacteriaceae bacterium]|jgi:hypothetical protein|nr:hypothetical protein [Propionibacteriaceae bacterium]